MTEENTPPRPTGLEPEDTYEHEGRLLWRRAAGEDAAPEPRPKCLRCGAAWVHRDDYAGLGTPHPYESAAGEDAAPRTEAGRRLLARGATFNRNKHQSITLRVGEWETAILAIEAEAAQGAAAPPKCKRCGHYEGCSTRCCMNQSEPCIQTDANDHH